MLSIKNIKNIHFTGIGGIGVSAIAKMMLKLGKNVSGSDILTSPIVLDLKKRGIKTYAQQQAKNVKLTTDLLIYSPAVPASNPERVRAKKLKIPEMSYPGFLGHLSKQYKTIAISGTHGKSTTTALIGLILAKAKLDPTVIVGSQVNSFDGNFRGGKGQYLVAEACEYRANMLNFNPWAIVLTNLEEDHLDYYKNLDDIIAYFKKFVLKLPTKGLLIYNADDTGCQQLLSIGLISTLTKKGIRIISYGLNRPTNFSVDNLTIKNGCQSFSILSGSRKIGQAELKVPGTFNVYNVLAAMALAVSLKIKATDIINVLNKFTGIWRRFEIVGIIKNDVLVVSDYAHHPTAIQQTLKAAKEFYPKRRLFLVYQPHQHNRTIKLFDDFVKCFGLADFVILNEIYDVAGRDAEKNQISAKQLVESIIKTGQLKSEQIVYSPDLSTTEKLIQENVKPHDLLLIMGAGEIDEVARRIVVS